MAPSDNDPEMFGYVVADVNNLDLSGTMSLYPVLAESTEDAIEAVKMSRSGFRFGGILSESMLQEQKSQLNMLRNGSDAKSPHGFIVAGYISANDKQESPVFYPIFAATQDGAIKNVSTEQPNLRVAGVMSELMINEQLRSIAALRRQGAATH